MGKQLVVEAADAMVEEEEEEDEDEEGWRGWLEARAVSDPKPGGRQKGQPTELHEKPGQRFLRERHSDLAEPLVTHGPLCWHDWTCWLWLLLVFVAVLGCRVRSVSVQEGSRRIQNAYRHLRRCVPLRFS